MNTWRNWSGSVVAEPSAIRYPATLEEIVAIVREARRRGVTVRPVGAGHSFTPLVATDGIVVSLDRYQGMESLDRATQRVTVRAGTRIKALGELLAQHGLAQENLGDIDVQSIAGAISTGTHGTGIQFGNLATQVRELTLVTGTGEIISCSNDQNPDIFKAAQISLGALGIIASVTLQAVPSYRLDYRWSREPLDDTLNNLVHEYTTTRNFEFYAFPHSSWAWVKRINRTDQAAQPHTIMRKLNDVVIENGVFWLMCEVCRRVPQLTPRIARVTGNIISSGRSINNSHQIFASQRSVRFHEMEYNLPIEALADTVRTIHELIEREHIRVNFPIECRMVRGDDIDLSPAYGRDSAYIAVHMYQKMPYQDYFRRVEAIFRERGGRPHWGKMHTLTANDLRALYPRWEHFAAIRRQLDPAGVFQNAYLRSLLG